MLPLLLCPGFGSQEGPTARFQTPSSFSNPKKTKCLQAADPAEVAAHQAGKEPKPGGEGAEATRLPGKLRSLPVAASHRFLKLLLSSLCAEPFEVRGLRVKDFSVWPRLRTLWVNGFLPTGAGDAPSPLPGCAPLLLRATWVTRSQDGAT